MIGNRVVWIGSVLALLWLLLKVGGVLAADVSLSWDAAAGAGRADGSGLRIVSG